MSHPSSDYDIDLIIQEAQQMKADSSKADHGHSASAATEKTAPSAADQLDYSEIVADLCSGNASFTDTSVRTPAETDAPAGEPAFRAAFTPVTPPTQDTPPVAETADKPAPVVVAPDSGPDDAQSFDFTPAQAEKPPKERTQEFSFTSADEETAPAAPVEQADTSDEEAPLSEADAEREDALRETREKKLNSFHLTSSEEEPNDPEEEREVYEEEEINDYNNPEDAPSVASELQFRRRTTWLTVFLSVVLEAVLIGLSMMYQFALSTMLSAQLYILLNAALLVILTVVNYRVLRNGLSGLLHLDANADSPCALAVVFSLAHMAFLFFQSQFVADNSVPLLACAAGLGLTLGSIGRLAIAIRTHENFRFISYTGDKFAAHLIDDEQDAEDVGRAAVAIGTPQVLVFRKAGFLSHFLWHSGDNDAGDSVFRIYTPVCLAVSLLLAVAYHFLTPHAVFASTLTVFVSCFCLTTPAAALCLTNLPLLRTCRKTLRHGGMISSWNAVRKFGRLNAVTVDAADLFPGECVLLHGIKTFSGTRIDEAIMDAAAVVLKAGGPLCGVFRRVIQDRTAILSAAESVVCEPGAGVTGWVGSRRVLVGNRKLLENQGVDVPSSDYENRYTKNGRKLVYVSIAGQLSAMFVLSYLADESVAASLHELERAHVTMLVHSTDANINESLLCDLFDLDGFYVEVLGGAAADKARELTHPTDLREEALLATTGRLEGLGYALSSVIRLRRSITVGLILQIMSGFFGFAIAAVLALYSHTTFSSLLTTSWLLGWFLLIRVVQLFSRT